MSWSTALFSFAGDTNVSLIRFFMIYPTVISPNVSPWSICILTFFFSSVSFSYGILVFTLAGALYLDGFDFDILLVVTTGCFLLFINCFFSSIAFFASAIKSLLATWLFMVRAIFLIRSISDSLLASSGSWADDIISSYSNVLPNISFNTIWSLFLSSFGGCNVVPPS